MRLDASTLISNNELTKDHMADLYLDWFNNFLTVSSFAYYHGLTATQASDIIDQGKVHHENRV